MIARSEAKYIRISSRKVKLILDVIKGQRVIKASAILDSLNKKASYLVSKVLKSALSSAKEKGYSEAQLFISKAIANQGPSLKRFRAASFGRASVIRKRTSHILLELDTPEKIVEKAKIK
ncbi:MAG: 50S ribosomal protein L22 [Candidatus Omnitrophota bacterium]